MALLEAVISLGLPGHIYLLWWMSSSMELSGALPKNFNVTGIDEYLYLFC